MTALHLSNLSPLTNLRALKLPRHGPTPANGLSALYALTALTAFTLISNAPIPYTALSGLLDATPVSYTHLTLPTTPYV